MTQDYELVVKGVRNFENKVAVTVALRDKKHFDGEIFDLDISLDRVEGAALEFYEAAARRSIRQVFLDVAAGLCEGDEQSPEKRPVILEAQNVWITYKGKLPGRITGSLKTPPTAISARTAADRPYLIFAFMDIYQDLSVSAHGQVYLFRSVT